MPEVRVCEHGEIADGTVRVVRTGHLEIGVIRQDGRYYAYRNLCPHQGGPACEGRRMPAVRSIVEDGVFRGQTFDDGDIHIVCPWHGWSFHLSDGINVCDARHRLRRFEVVERDGAVYVAV